MITKIKLKDSKLSVGIFEVIGDTIGTVSELVENLQGVRNAEGDIIYDGGIMFHRDLVKYMYNNAQLNKEDKEFIKNHLSNSNLHAVFPRGRICYNETQNRFEIYSNREVLTDVDLVQRILSEFDLGGRTVKPFIDEQHYNLVNKNNI